MRRVLSASACLDGLKPMVDLRLPSALAWPTGSTSAGGQHERTTKRVSDRHESQVPGRSLSQKSKPSLRASQSTFQRDFRGLAVPS